MDNVRSTLALNLSNQANTSNSRKTDLSQFNFFILLGLECLENLSEVESVPISVNISKLGEVTLNGLDTETIDNRNICVYSDKKVTSSNE